MMSTPIISAKYDRFDKQTSKIVIFNSDDFGLSASSNAGIIACHEQGVVHSTSVMAGGSAFDQAAAYARGSQSLDTGLHLALCEVRPVTDPAEIPSLVASDGNFHPDFGTFLKQYIRGGVSKQEIEKEFRAQVEKMSRAGLKISHLDSHQHLHALPAVFEIVARLAAEYRIPSVRLPDERHAPVLRAALEGRAGRAAQRLALSVCSRLGGPSLARHGIATPDHFSGFMEMGRWNDDSLRACIRSLRHGLTEICCHPRSEPGTEAGCDFRAEMAALSGAGLKQLLEEKKVKVTSFREYFTTSAPPGGPAVV